MSNSAATNIVRLDPADSDPADMAPARTPAGMVEHYCEHPGCCNWGGFGFAPPRQPSRWFCFEHREDGELHLNCHRIPG